ncbi:Trypsin domain containing protein, partial [Asbolus verrucosus]
MVAITVQTQTTQHFCGGALISNEWILTAAQCVHEAVLLTVRLGSIHLKGDDSSSVTVATSHVVQHPDFDSETLENDIGLVKLRLPVELTDYIQPIRLGSINLPTTARPTALGWGQTGDTDPELASTLNYVTVAVLSNTECRITYGNQITDNMVCVDGNYNEGACIGDSGSPLVVRPIGGTQLTHVGISSFFSGNGCESTDPSGYTRTYPYIDWIKNIIGGDTARVSQFRFAAAIHVHTEDSTFFCGGSLTGNQWIITSGHCAYNATLFTIQLGSSKLTGEDPNRVIVSTSTYFLHPDFNPDSLDNDIAVIKLRMPVMLNGYIQPIYMSSSNYVNSTTVIAFGFGQTTDPELSNELKYVTLTTIPNAECRIFYGNQITDNMICASGNYNEGTCIGDTGGGLIITNGKHNLLVGVSSFISGNGCESTDPSGYTRAYPYTQ